MVIKHLLTGMIGLLGIILKLINHQSPLIIPIYWGGWHCGGTLRFPYIPMIKRPIVFFVDDKRPDDGALRADGCLSATADAWPTGISGFGCEWRGCSSNLAFWKRWKNMKKNRKNIWNPMSLTKLVLKISIILYLYHFEYLAILKKKCPFLGRWFFSVTRTQKLVVFCDLQGLGINRSRLNRLVNPKITSIASWCLEGS